VVSDTLPVLEVMWTRPLFTEADAVKSFGDRISMQSNLLIRIGDSDFPFTVPMTILDSKAFATDGAVIGRHGVCYGQIHET
jgi:hypothetical protein